MKRFSRVSIPIGLSIVLAACGGGGGGGGFGGPPVADTGVGGSGGVTGPVQGFGSIIVNDLVLDVDDAEFQIEGEAAGIGQSGQSQLAEGQQLVVRGDLDALDADEVFYRADVRGPLAAAPVFDPLTGVGQMTVLGQTVRINAATRYDDGAALDLLQAGDLLEISGNRNANGELVATYVALETSLSQYKVVGTVTAVGSTGFSIGGLDVDANGLAIPAAGTLVEVRFPASAFPGSGAIPASAIETLGELELDEGERFEIQGFIDSFTSASSFTVSGIPVTVPAGIEFEDGSADDLELNVRLEVEGVADAAGRLVAERIIFRTTEAIRFEGIVGAVDPVARTISTSVGLTFVVRDLTELEDDSDLDVEPFTLEDLNPGVDFVEVRGFRDGSELVAAEIEREEFEPDDPTVLRAPADDAPAIGGSGELNLSLLGVGVVGDPAITEFEDDDDNTVSADVFAGLVQRGVIVEVRWDAFSATTQPADDMTIEEEDD
jgi:hypothetical protein